MQALLLLLLKYRYLILIPLAAFEGPVISLMVGFLVYSHVFNFWLAYLVLLLGDFGPDTLFYCIGYFGQEAAFVKKYFLKTDFFRNHFDVVKKLWDDHPVKTMFFGKLAYGLALPFLVSAGMTKMPYKKFVSLTIPISIFQYTILTGIGYYLGSSYARALKYVDYAYLILAALVVIFVIVYVFVVKYARREIAELEKAEEKNT